MYRLNISSKKYGDVELIKDFEVNIEKNKVTCLFGPSGCGKTTLLNIMAGLDKDYEGSCEIPRDGLSYVFQEYRIIPWLTVYENIEYVLKDKVPDNQLSDYIHEYLDKVELVQYKDNMPNELSGGMKQRVALARGFANPHQVLILDEPFVSIDYKLMDALIVILKKLISEDGKTVILVTHDLNIAKELSDRILFLDNRPIEIIKEIVK